ncbi:MAG: 3-isopropylmalate dehydratase [Bacteroidota bacterium]|nr:3-isopropylmalate dehydratase [Candidatus Kapabacteria bacterium]MDW8219209.1 3-isopropylmalate dehydratase [Bacteroidota bacterium]
MDSHACIRASAYVYEGALGDNIDTDRIIPGKYTKTLDISLLASHVMEDLDPEFRYRFIPGSILVAGDNFGCGSSREQAPIALKAAGVSVIIARYFARIFFRNAINIGLPVLEVPHHAIAHGAILEVHLREGTVTDISAGVVYKATRMPKVMVDILAEGGLVPYLQKYGDYVL